MNTFDSFAEHYSSLPDDDLQRISLDVQSLVPQAREALRTEFERRHLQAETIDWAAQSIPEKPEKSDGTVQRFFRNLLIFFVCGLVDCMVIATLLSIVPRIDMEQVGEGMADFVLGNSILLSFVTARYLIPKRIKIVWVIGIVEPPCVFLLFGVLRLLF
jgi:hypothetical protein